MRGLYSVLSFRGRANRTEWWLYSIAINVLQIAAFIAVSALVFGADATSLHKMKQAGADSLPVVCAIRTAAFWPTLALWVRRAHDRGSAGGLAATYLSADLAMWLFVFASTVSAGAHAFLASITVLFPLVTVTFNVASLIFSVLMGLMPGTPGRNRYGLSPNGKGEPAYRPHVLTGEEPA